MSHVVVKSIGMVAVLKAESYAPCMQLSYQYKFRRDIEPRLTPEYSMAFVIDSSRKVYYT
jgi:hypothetical protein